KDAFRPAQLDSLIAALTKYRPDLIGVESMSGSLVAELERKGLRYKEVIEDFAKDRVEKGHLAQKLLKTTRDDAERKADELLSALAKAEKGEAALRLRSNLVLALVGEYDITPALLKWSYLPQELQARNEAVPAEIGSYLKQQLGRPDEIAAIS